MKTLFKIEELNHTDLVDLFSTATYESCNFTIRKRKADYYGTHLQSDDDCAEDTWAKVLLDNEKNFVYFYDLNAEDESEHYGTLEHEWIEDKGMRYKVTLADIINGINKAWRDGSKSDKDSVLRYIENENEGDFDNYDAELLVQWILFGEPIYG